MFNTDELGDIVSPYATVTTADGTMVHDWRSAPIKYSKLPGIRSLHDFFFVKHAATKQLVAKVRDTCYDGVFMNAPIHVIRGRNIVENCIPDQESLCSGKFCLNIMFTSSTLSMLVQKSIRSNVHILHDSARTV